MTRVRCSECGMFMREEGINTISLHGKIMHSELVYSPKRRIYVCHTIPKERL